MASRQPGHKGTIGTVTEHGLPTTTDVVVIGSGGAGLTAALTAARDGARVLVVESLEIVGGATGVSAGAAWIPAHGFSTEALGVSDSLDDARTYMYGEGRRETLDPEVVETFLQEGPRVARYVEDNTKFGWIPVIWPDYRSDIPGASVGRALFPGPYNAEGLGEAARYVRPELASGMAKNPMPFWALAGLKKEASWMAGPALVGALLEAALEAGVEVRVEAPAERLVIEDGAVAGLVVRDATAADGTAEHTVRADHGVIIASGGFETSDEMTTEYLDGPLGTHVSPKGHRGIAVQLAEEVDAELTSMDAAWWMPGVQIPGETLDGVPFARLLLGERSLPHSIIVNKAGKRFANEALPYDQFGAAMRAINEEAGGTNDPAYFVFDQNFWEKYGLFGAIPGGEVPEYIHRADSLSALAEKLGVDEIGLLRTVDEFNPEAAAGRDPWFGRGETLFDRYFGDFKPFLGRFSSGARFPAATMKAQFAVAKAVAPIVNRAAAKVAKANDSEAIRKAIVGPLAAIMRPVLKAPRSSTLGPLEKGPFYAVEVRASALGTVGGPATDARGRVLTRDGSVVPGLYSAGNAGGAPTKGFYAGAGGTISLGLVFGHLAGREAAATPLTREANADAVSA
ncbi:FAD-dependent oxidoreductase [Dietzia sp. E1]|uniref:FAD-dependent oxidoreductase n=1 Tax=Dietzia sp. E1 TaxID=328361 RepID=UPI0001F64D70|nr:FAD-dependent oxidoreductase [Dietzia sp. E1]EFV91754.1 fumarate reductase/succinate dehydrogenase flavoprotein domain protein [Dietzia cinnamea P4]MBB1020849.1 FAD-dependent oxidoreductase [Dietzia sp. E1]